MEDRYLSNIELKDDRIIKFIHSEEMFSCAYESCGTEAIAFYNNTLHFYPANGQNSAEVYKATEEDFKEFKKVISKSPYFVCCGDGYIFSLENVVSFSEKRRDNTLQVDCRNEFYNIKIKNKEDFNDFIMAMQKKWQKMFTEWDQNNSALIGE